MKSSSISQLKLTTIFGAAAVSAALACTVAIAPAHAVTAAEKEAEAEAALTQLNAMQETLDQASNAYLTALTDYEAAIRERDATQGRINELTDEISEIQGRLGTRARDMYRNGSTSFVDLLLGSASFEEFTQNWDLLNRLNATDAELSSKSRMLRSQAEAEKIKYTQQAEIADQKAKEASEAYQQAQVLVQQMQETYAALSAEAQALYAQEQAAMYATEGGVVNDDGTVTDIQTGQTYASASAYVAATGNAIVDRARAMIGSDYVWGGVGGSDGGFDCSGLVSYALTGENTRVGTSYSIGEMYARVDDPQAGDLYVSNGHIAVYTGEGTVVEAVDYGIGVQENAWREREGGFFVRPQ
ncbi:MAG: C40 family peptidase [Eggerthellaceae bacterium]|nr:C40 family peptidase [Eggerthellaceae bacterium]